MKLKEKEPTVWRAYNQAMENMKTTVNQPAAEEERSPRPAAGEEPLDLARSVRDLTCVVSNAVQEIRVSFHHLKFVFSHL
jgi:hypothetical protein